jgi:hypothetical protein
VPAINAFMTQTLGPYWRTLVFGSLFALLFGVGLFWLCIALSATPRSFAFNLLICLVGLLLGWAVGMFFSPFSKGQAASFQFVGKTVGAFISGYVLSKLEKVIAKLIAGAEEDPVNYVQWDRVGLFAGSFLLATVVVFVSRVHAPPDQE